MIIRFVNFLFIRFGNKELLKKEKSYFLNKTCNICKSPAKIYRLIRGQHFLLCHNRDCSYKVEVITGFIPNIIKIEQ